MNADVMDVLRKEERTTLALRALYERYGYRKYRMGKFEEYDLYLENKNFLKSQNIITFHDMDGRVKALKPDVTLSIAKNTHATRESSEKFYYLENVYRLDKQSGAYREISQLGLEYIGSLDVYATSEVVALAQETLERISPKHMMQLTHIGYLLSMLEELGVDAPLQEALLDCVRRKNRHELLEKAEGGGLSAADALKIADVTLLSGALPEAAKKARGAALNQTMREAVDELEGIDELLRARGKADALLLDFSLVSDAEYYCGVLFQGFVEGVPRALLSGGYYGNLMKKFRRPLDAIGFAVYLNELTRLDGASRRKDADAFVLYGPDSDLTALYRAVAPLYEAGLRVRVERALPEGASFETIYRFENGALREVGSC